MKKIFSRLIISSLIVGGLNFSPIVFDAENTLQIISVAHAEIQTYTASGSAILDFGEDDEQFVEAVKNIAKMHAIKAAKEQAGIFFTQFSKVENGILTADDISAYTSNNIEIIDVTYKKNYVKVQDVAKGDIVKISVMYEATVTAKIDTFGLADYIDREEEDKYNFIQQNKYSQEFAEEIDQTFEDLKKTAENKNSEQIKSEVTKIYTKLLAQEELEEGLKLVYKKNYQAAIPKFTEAIKLNPELEWAYNNRGSAYNRLKNYERAISDLNKAIELKSNEIFYINRGFSYFRLNNYDAALKDFSKAVEINPNIAEPYFFRGAVYTELKNYDAAIKDFDKAVEKNPKSKRFHEFRAKIYVVRGLTYLVLKNYDAAKETLDKAVELNPNLAEAYDARGTLYTDLKDYEAAVKDFSMSIQLNPNNAKTYQKRGFVYILMENYEQALNNFSRAVKLNPKDPTAYQSRGTCYKALGKDKKAEADFAKAKKLGYGN